MTGGHALATIALVAQVYGIQPAQMECISWHESRHDTEAVNGIHQGLYQYRPDTFNWMLSLALDDPMFLHGYLFAEPDPYDPLQAITLTAWALRNGDGEHWSAYRFCWDIR